MLIAHNKRKSNSAIVIILATTLIMTSLFAGGAVIQQDDVVAHAASGSAERLAHPWDARTAATGDYIYDSYDGIPQNHVFENVTTDRLLDILSLNGNYYIVFAGPEHVASQKILAQINARAKAKGVTKIYHFDPYVDGYQLDATGQNGIADVTGGTSVNFTGTAKISDVWKLIAQLLPPSAAQPSGALYGYDGKDTLLLNVKISNRTETNLEIGKSIVSSYKLTESVAIPSSFDASSQNTGIDAVLAGGTASVRTELDFFKRLYNGSASYFESTRAESADRIGAAVEIFSESDFPGSSAGSFPLDSVDVKELYDLLNTSGDKLIFFAGQGCHNTQAIIGTLAKRAKTLGVSKIYVVDFALDSNVKFGTGANIDQVTANSATGGLWIRSPGLESGSPYKYGYSYLYGYLAQYLGSGFVTENSSKKNASVKFFLNGNLGGTTSVDPYYNAGSGASPQYIDNAGLLPTDVPNARRLQVPTFVRYNKDHAAKTTAHWIHKNRNVVDTRTGTYTEYMLELSWVRATEAAKADKTTSAGRDGLTKVEFASEAIAALDNVLGTGSKVTTPIGRLTKTSIPVIKGTAKIGVTFGLDWGTWAPWPSGSRFTFQWYRNGSKIAGATTNTYKTVAADIGKKITASVTAIVPGYVTTTKTSLPTASVKGYGFEKAPKPKISGKAKVGNTLKASLGKWNPTPKFNYQWFANGKAIKGATKASFRLKSAQKGKKITVRVTAIKKNYETTIKTSKATAKVGK